MCWYGMRRGNKVWRIEKEDGRKEWMDTMGELEVKKIEADETGS